MSENKKFFDSNFLKKLELLTLVSKRIRAGQTKGERKSIKRGHSLEFADYRNYSRGDDLRYLDWNIYGRLDKLFIKLFAEEEDLHIHILMDSSKSMEFGNPVKLDYAKRVAGALGYIGLANYDAVGVGSFSGQLGSSVPPMRSKARVFQLFDFISNIHSDGETQFNRSIREYAGRQTKPGTAIVISDFLDPAGYEDGLRHLLSRRYEIFVLQILSPEEIDPPYRGDLKLVDSENNTFREVTISERVMKRYKETLSHYCAQLQNFCRTRGIIYLRTSTSVPFEDLILKYLTKSGVLT